MNLPYKLIKKYSLTPEDQDDIKSEIALSELQYGYQRKLDFIIIDYLSKTRGYKRIGEGGKRECVFKTEEYSETSDKSPRDNRALRVSGNIAVRGYSETDRVAQFDESNNLNYLSAILNNASERTKQIMMDFYNGETLLNIGLSQGITESRAWQLVEKNHAKITLFSALRLNPEIAKVVKW